MALRRVATNKRKRGPTRDLKGTILSRAALQTSISVWTPNDFLDLGSRSAVDKALQRLEASGKLRRIDRGLYDIPRHNQLTGNPSTVDPIAVIAAVGRRDKARLLPDGITAANELGLTNAVPAKITIHTDARLRPIRLNHLVIDFKLTAPKRLFWAGRPAMRVVQSLHWLHDMLPTETDSVLRRIKRILLDPKGGQLIRSDLEQGIDALPGWMRELVKNLLEDAGHRHADVSAAPKRRSVGRQLLGRQAQAV